MTGIERAVKAESDAWAKSPDGLTKADALEGLQKTFRDSSEPPASPAGTDFIFPLDQTTADVIKSVGGDASFSFVARVLSEPTKPTTTQFRRPPFFGRNGLPLAIRRLWRARGLFRKHVWPNRKALWLHFLRWTGTL